MNKVLEKESLDFIETETLTIDDFELFKKLLQYYSISGKEEYIKEFLLDELRKCNVTCFVDSKGNIFGTRGVSSSYPSFVAHQDVLNIENKFGSKKYTHFKNSPLNLNRTVEKETISDELKKKIQERKNKSGTVQDAEIESIWNKFEKERTKMWGSDYYEYRFKCKNCVNDCESFAPCKYFQPNENSDTKKIFAQQKTNYGEIGIGEESQVAFDFLKDDVFDKIPEKESISQKPSVMDEEKVIPKESMTSNVIIDLINDKIYNTDKDRVLGGDDKCGILLILKAIKTFPNKPVKVLFTVDEERGCHGVQYAIRNNRAWFDDIKYSVIIDRKDYNHLLWSQKGVRSCSNEFAGKIARNGVLAGIPVQTLDGGSSDVIYIREIVKDSVNISAGYYNPHKADEYVIPSKLDKIAKWVCNIFENI